MKDFKIHWRIITGAVIKALESVGLTPLVYECECGCKNAIVYARDDRALWIASTLSEEKDAFIHIMGLETRTEFDKFVQDTQTLVQIMNSDANHFDNLIARLRPLAPEGDEIRPFKNLGDITHGSRA